MAEDKNRLILPALSLDPMQSKSTLPGSQPKRESASRTSTACEACKRRKSKCVGRPPPCQMCKTSGTVCIIDATLDQRRKVSAKRLAGQSEIQRDLLASLFQYVRYAQLDELQDLTRCFSNNDSWTAAAQVLERFSSSLNPAQKFTDSRLDDLLDAYASVVRNRSSPGSTETVSSGRGSVVALKSAIRTLSDTESAEQSPSFQSSYQNPAQLPRQAYERWLQYFETQMPESADPGFDRFDQTLDQIQGINVSKGQLRASIFHSPGSYQPAEYFAPVGARVNFHPVLRIIPSEGDMSDVSSQSTSSLVGESESRSQPIFLNNDEHGFVELLRCFPSLHSPQSSASGALQFPTELQLSRYGIHSLQPLNRPENSPLSQIILAFREAARNFIACGNPPIQVLGSGGISVDLLFRARHEDDESSICNWASEIWRSFHDWNIFVRLANVVFYTHLMLWTILPTLESYAALPDLLKPTPLQRLVPHHAAIDFIPFPRLRDGLIHGFRDWMTILPRYGIDVNWDDGGTGIESAVWRDEATGHIHLTRRFEQWIYDKANWRIGRGVLAFLPELEEDGVVFN